jgi:hypothetical protein
VVDTVGAATPEVAMRCTAAVASTAGKVASMEVVELEGMEAAAVGVAAIARTDLPSAFADRGNIAGAQALLKKQRCSQTDTNWREQCQS